VTFDPAPARRGLDHIDMSFARWSEFLDAHPSRPMASSAVSMAQNLLAISYLIDLVRWIRSVDDYLAGRDAGPGAGLSTYKAARADPAIEGLLDGLRHAAHKSLHLPRNHPRGVPGGQGLLGCWPPRRLVGRTSRSICGPTSRIYQPGAVPATLSSGPATRPTSADTRSIPSWTL